MTIERRLRKASRLAIWFEASQNLGERVAEILERYAIEGEIPSHTFICEGVMIEDEVFIGHGLMFTNDRYPRTTTINASYRSGPTGNWRPQECVGRRRLDHPDHFAWAHARRRCEGRSWRCHNQDVLP